ncbi:MAG: diguanylate cyclase [Comamonadaceae bacterium]|nr:MAG: diguanylate cyclase [Comamonadaceae bacterium]
MQYWLWLAAWLMVPALAWAEPPTLELKSAGSEVNLTPRMAVHGVPDHLQPMPDALWAAPVAPPAAEPPEQYRLSAGESLVGRIRLRTESRNTVYLVEVPSPRIDEVRLWYRNSLGGAWQGAEAGDRVALARWPFTGPNPAFSVPLEVGQTDLLILLTNAGRLDVPVLMRTDKAFSQARMRQSNLSGLIMGMGLMVAVVCLIAAVTRRGRPAWVLFAYAVWVVLTVTSLNGYAAIWFLPDLPQLADGGKHLTAVVMAGLMVWVVAVSLDRLRPGPVVRFLGPGLTGIAAGYGLVHFTVLPPAWRVAGALVFSVACIAAALWLCLLSRFGGGRYVSYVAGGVLAYAAVLGLGLVGVAPVMGLDLRSAMAACLLFGGVLSFRHAQFSRERYGRDVLGRAATGLLRDPLTALLSHAGLRDVCEEMLLRQSADGRPSQLLYLALPGLKKAETEHGFVLTERALVRLAATLQRTLGDRWAIARPSQDRFACVAHGAMQEELPELTTRLLAHCARLEDPPAPLADFGLRIVACERRVDGEALNLTLQEMEVAACAIRPGRRIALI